jgi:hypothetical protein
MLTSAAVGVIVMVLFEYPLTRVIGVAALFAFIVSGVFLIADPAFLGPDEDAGGDTRPPARVVSRRTRRGEHGRR